MMSPSSDTVDVYAIAPARTSELVGEFLNRFAPVREELTDEYHVPQFNDAPTHRFGNDPWSCVLGE